MGEPDRSSDDSQLVIDDRYCHANKYLAPVRATKGLGAA